MYVLIITLIHYLMYSFVNDISTKHDFISYTLIHVNVQLLTRNCWNLSFSIINNIYKKNHDQTQVLITHMYCSIHSHSTRNNIT